MTEAASAPARFDRPIIIVSTPRAGSTLLFETLEQAPRLYATGQESHWLIEDIPGLHPAARGWDSNRLTAADATPQIAEALAGEFYRQIRNRDGHAPTGRVRMLEKTPKNALRIPLFDAVFPDAMFVYLYRDVRQTIASMMEAWASGAFRTYPELPGWTGYPWSLLLVPGWRDLIGRPLSMVVAHQWATTTRIMLDDLEKLPPDRVKVMAHDRFLADPQGTSTELTRSLDLGWDRELGGQLPLSKVTVSRPSPDKWRRLEREIESVMPIVKEADERARQFLTERS
ncbi:hypothetical protein GCM10022276_26250 [Sphingomonas limnosediminicola]|uniref:Sulfotransferase n=1 Tax=Sphingomonas limnosediminicola TaxID=940133 RepID=A0ABP7LQ98_9SPHN